MLIWLCNFCLFGWKLKSKVKISVTGVSRAFWISLLTLSVPSKFVENYSTLFSLTIIPPCGELTVSLAKNISLVPSLDWVLAEKFFWAWHMAVTGCLSEKKHQGVELSFLNIFTFLLSVPPMHCLILVGTIFNQSFELLVFLHPKASVFGPWWKWLLSRSTKDKFICMGWWVWSSAT
jgi:hypothetical protein